MSRLTKKKLGQRLVSLAITCFFVIIERLLTVLACYPYKKELLELKKTLLITRNKPFL